MDSLTEFRQSVSNDVTTDITTDITQNITDQLIDAFSWIIIPSLIITIVLVVLFIYRSIRRYKLEKAIFEIRDTLREIKLSQQPPASQPDVTDENTPSSRDR